MFDAIGDMPLHPLVIRAAVIGIPLALLLALLFAVPRTRGWTRWPLAVTAVGALVATFVSKESGEALRSVVVQPDSPVAPLIDQHAQLAGQLLIIMAVFTVVALANVLLVSLRTVGAASAAPRRGVLGVVLPLLLVVVGVVAGVWVYRVGDIGSRAVWNPTGAQDYSSSGNR